MSSIRESAINIVAEGTRIEGDIALDEVSRVYGVLVGKVKSKAKTKDSGTLILCETSLVEGDIDADTVIIDGFVRGDIVASKRVVVSGTGRVVGNIRTPSLNLEFGAYFEGRCEMDEPVKANPALRPAEQS